MALAQPYRWSSAESFVGRQDELAALNSWWGSERREPVAMLGRRRVGKSWLFRRFAVDKPTVILVASEVTQRSQLDRFATQLAPLLGVTPALASLPELLRVLYRAARAERLLVVIDEFPLLLGPTATERQRNLTAIQAVLEEERDDSQVKLILCGSHIGTMESLFEVRNPLHGRLERFDVRPLDFAAAREFLTVGTATEQFQRFAVAGGMPLYLGRLATGSLDTAVCNEVLSPRSSLFAEGSALLDRELNEPRVYFSLLEQMSPNAVEVGELAGRAGFHDSRAIQPYLHNLTGLRIASRHDPFGASPTSRDGRWQIDDPFLRFWFRFVFPYRSDLEAGLAPRDLFRTAIAPQLPGHVAAVFESWCAEWLRANRPEAGIRWGRWWGKAANRYRRTKQRWTEEIDAVGARNSTVTAVAEAKWTNKPMTPSVVHDLRTYKLPALADSRLGVEADPAIILFSRSGYSRALLDLAASDPRIELIDVPAALAPFG